MGKIQPYRKPIKLINPAHLPLKIDNSNRVIKLLELPLIGLDEFVGGDLSVTALLRGILYVKF